MIKPLFIRSSSSYYNVSYHHHHLGRVCPGKHLAHSTLKLAAASVLSTFDLQRKLDEYHREIEPKREYKLQLIW